MLSSSWSEENIILTFALCCFLSLLCFILCAGSQKSWIPGRASARTVHKHHEQHGDHEVRAISKTRHSFRRSVKRKTEYDISLDLDALQENDGILEEVHKAPLTFSKVAPAVMRSDTAVQTDVGEAFDYEGLSEGTTGGSQQQQGQYGALPSQYGPVPNAHYGAVHPGEEMLLTSQISDNYQVIPSKPPSTSLAGLLPQPTQQGNLPSVSPGRAGSPRRAASREQNVSPRNRPSGSRGRLPPRPAGKPPPSRFSTTNRPTPPPNRPSSPSRPGNAKTLNPNRRSMRKSMKKNKGSFTLSGTESRAAARRSQRNSRKMRPSMFISSQDDGIGNAASEVVSVVKSFIDEDCVQSQHDLNELTQKANEHLRELRKLIVEEKGVSSNLNSAIDRLQDSVDEASTKAGNYLSSGRYVCSIDVC